MQVKFIILFQVIFQNKQKNYSNAARSRYFILGKFGGSSLIPNNYNAYAEI